MTTLLVDEDGAQVYYVPHWLSSEEATQLFQEALTWTWLRHQIRINGKQVNMAHLSYGCADPGVKHYYSGNDHPLEPWQPSLLRLKNRICQETGLSLNSCLANYYRDGDDYIGWHADAETRSSEMIQAPSPMATSPPQHAVVTVSLGASRDFQLRKKVHFSPQVSPKPTITQSLTHGDALIMLGQTQQLYKHQLPKRKGVGPRICLTFRLLASSKESNKL